MNDPDKPILEPNTAYADPKATLQARGVADAEGLERSSAFVATTSNNPLTARSTTPRQTIAEALAAASEATTPAFHTTMAPRRASRSAVAVAAVPRGFFRYVPVDASRSRTVTTPLDSRSIWSIARPDVVLADLNNESTL